MKKYTQENDLEKELTEGEFLLEDMARKGAREMLAYALEDEINRHVEQYKHLSDEKGRRIVVRNGYHPERDILTGIGPLTIRQPRVDDRKLPEADRFSCKMLPRYMRRAPSIDNLIPVLYLKGISTNEFQNALSSILGEGAKGLSAATVVRLKQIWETEYKIWSKRDLSGKRYVYIWADGIHCNVRLDDQKSCLLVILGADEHGNKELIAVNDGYRESKASWKEILLDVKQRGLKNSPKLAVGDGALGFWAALEEEYPTTKQQRCWVHKTANILDKLPKAIQSKAKSMIQDMYMADTEENALRAYDHFMEAFPTNIRKPFSVL